MEINDAILEKMEMQEDLTSESITGGRENMN